MTPKLLQNKFNRRSISVAKLLPLEKSSPSSEVSWQGALTDAYAIWRSTLVYNAFADYCIETSNYSLIDNLGTVIQKFKNVISKQGEEFLTNSLPMKDAARKIFEQTSAIPTGQLAFKEEAAGKLRVFAMVDVWTQSVLKPLHDALFKVLSLLPNDGTFDQEASFARCIEKAKISKCAYGYDLSAATDRLPLRLQIAILGTLIGPKAARAWGDLLVGRGYYMPSSADRYGYTPGEPIFYKVGQPMGALSS